MYRRGVREWLPPAIYSWRSHKRWRDVDQLYDGVPELPDGAIRYEGGMQNFGGIFALGAVLDWMHELGPSRIEERVLELASKARAVLRDRGGRLAADQGRGMIRRLSRLVSGSRFLEARGPFRKGANRGHGAEGQFTGLAACIQ